MVKPSRFIESLEPYKITPQDVWSEQAPQDLLKLDWNEAPHDFDLYRQEMSRIVQERGMVAWYPDYLALQLTDALARFLARRGDDLHSGNLCGLAGVLCLCIAVSEHRGGGQKRDRWMEMAILYDALYDRVGLSRRVAGPGDRQSRGDVGDV